MSPAAGRQSSPRRVAMDYLARREHSVEELRRKLAAREFSGDQIDATLADLVREGLLSDARFGESFAGSRARRGQGPLRVQAELRNRGLGEELVEIALDGPDWTAVARTARQKKFGPEIPVEFAARARQARFLQYRGFTGEQIRQALAGDWEQD